MDGGRLGYMTFVSMVMVSQSPTRSALMCVCECVRVCVYFGICVSVMAFLSINNQPLCVGIVGILLTQDYSKVLQYSTAMNDP